MIIRDDYSGKRPLNEASRDIIWQVAVAESDPKAPFDIAALNLLAATGRREAFSLLWDHLHTANATLRRSILAAMVAIDPGDELDALLEAYGSLPETGLAPSSMPSLLRRIAASQFIEPFRVSIPFERLAAVLRSPKVTLRAVALRLISYIDDPRVVPLLVKHLSKPMPELREIALGQLRRLHAASAADQVAKLMAEDEPLRRVAAETLVEWSDPRGVPEILAVMQEELPKAIIRHLGKISHPAFDRWLLDTLDTLLTAEVSDAAPTLKDMFEAVVEVKSPLLQQVCERLLRTTVEIDALKLQVIRAVGQLDADWCPSLLRELILGTAALPSYTALTQSKDHELGQQMIKSRSELQRVLAIRLLWLAKDWQRLLGCLEGHSAAVRDMAVWALSSLHIPETADVLREVVHTADRIDLWRVNRAVLAWRALAMLRALPDQAQSAQAEGAK